MVNISAPRDLPRATGPAPAAGLARLGPAAGWFLAVKALGLTVLVIWCGFTGKAAYTLLSARWDSLWYVRVVRDGYGFTVTAADGRVLSDEAFFPLFPWLERGLSDVLPIGPADAGVIISALASVAAAVAIFLIADGFRGPRFGLYTTVLWAALPVGIVQSMAYSESLFTALSAWALHLLSRRHWLAAGLLASAAGLTRPVGLAVAAAVWVAAAVSLRADGFSPRPLLAALIAPTGAAGYILWVGARDGGPLAYLDVQKAWGNGFDGGAAFARFTWGLMSGWGIVAGVLLTAGVALLLRTYWSGFRAKVPLPVQVYSGIVIVLALGTSGFFGSKPRLLIPAFGILFPIALYLERRGTRTAWTVLGTLAGVCAVYGAFWLNGSGPP